MIFGVEAGVFGVEAGVFGVEAGVFAVEASTRPTPEPCLYIPFTSL